MNRGMDNSDLARMPKLLERAAEGLSDERLRFTPEGAEFSFVGQACHLRDLEVEGYGVRIRRILTEDDPALANFDGAAVAAERNYDAQDFGEALAAFRDAREANLRAVEGLTDEQFARTGVFDGSKKVTLVDVLAMMREHDAEHAEQLNALRPER